MEPSSNKTRILHGERIGKQGMLRVGCSATLFDGTRTRVFLTRRMDNGEWCLPGGMMEAGESVEEACLREMFEETGLRVKVVRLIGVYSSPHRLVIYPDGNRVQYVIFNFEVETIAGEPGLSNETTDFGFFSLAEIAEMEMLDQHAGRIQEAMLTNGTAFIIKATTNKGNAHDHHLPSLYRHPDG
jgi:ADP-ribose pyrophosphatase YjhB (NUDIX family)